MTMHISWWTSLVPSSFQFNPTERWHLEVSLKILCSKSNLSHLPDKSRVISGCLSASYTQMWKELLDVLQISMRHTTWRDAPCMDRVLADWSMVNKEDIIAAGLWHVLTSKQLSSSVGALWPACSKLRMSGWPGLLSTELVFWCHSCARFHPEAAVLEKGGWAFKYVSWFRLNSAIKGRETPYSGDLLQWLGTNPRSRGAEGHNLTFKLAAMGQDCKHYLKW